MRSWASKNETNIFQDISVLQIIYKIASIKQRKKKESLLVEVFLKQMESGRTAFIFFVNILAYCNDLFTHIHHVLMRKVKNFELDFASSRIRTRAVSHPSSARLDAA